MTHYNDGLWKFVEEIVFAKTEQALEHGSGQNRVQSLVSIADIVL